MSRASVASQREVRQLHPMAQRRSADSRPQRTHMLATAQAGIVTERTAEAKRTLWDAIEGTSRGGSVTAQQRGLVEEAQVAVEACAGEELDFGLLEGCWRLVYTTAPDVAPLVTPLASQGPGPFRVGSIYQTFSSVEQGRVENVIKFSLQPLLNDGDGATLRVGARFEPRGSRRILLLFEDIQFGEVKISSGLQAALAPAMLPRSWLNQRILSAIQEFRVQLPLDARPAMGLMAPLSGSSSSSGGRQRPTAAGGYYLLTYCDEDTLVGRQQAGGGTFIFSREPSPV